MEIYLNTTDSLKNTTVQIYLGNLTYLNFSFIYIILLLNINAN